jgi:hypothetical protein
MGAAFVTHFTLNYIRSPKTAPLGRFKLPTKSQYGAVAAAILIPFGAAETIYFVGAPESTERSGGVGNYLISGEISYEILGNNTEYVNDGETLMIDLNTNNIEWSTDNRNVVGVLVTLTYSEDETNSGLTCVGSQSQSDTIYGTITHGDYNGTGSGENQNQGSSSHEILVEWYNSSLYLSGNASGMSESQIINELDSMGKGLGAYLLEINVEAESGGRPGCSHTDNGEEVEYLLEVMLLDYEIRPA